jgi:uncharacterized membrane protein (UPF0127 family)
MTPMRRLAITTLAVLVAGCAHRDALTTGSAEITGDAGPRRLTVEIADSDGERRRGLMDRSSLAADAGMVFLYDEDRDGAFWMKDTTIPLSIAFFDADGRILRILDMEPCRRDPCPLYDPGVDYRGALEVRRGSFARWGVAPGDRITIDR